MQTIYVTRLALSRLPEVLVTQTLELAKEGYRHVVRHINNQYMWIATDPAPMMNVDKVQWDILGYMADGELVPSHERSMPNWLVLDIDANTLTNTVLGLTYHYVPIDSLV